MHQDTPKPKREWKEGGRDSFVSECIEIVVGQ